jgi:hypothetical protein
VEIGAAELAVGDALQPHVLLELDDLGDRLVLDRAQLLGADRRHVHRAAGDVVDEKIDDLLGDRGGIMVLG